jgi:hemoglobin-like flavoprotein
MTARERQLVWETFQCIRDDAADVALLFYGRLFEIEPGLRPMFHNDVSRQGVKLMEMLASVVEAMDHLDSLTPTLHALGQRHTSYGVVPRHYEIVERALVWAIGQVLSLESGSEAANAWRKLIRELGAIMQTGAQMAQNPTQPAGVQPASS